MAHFCHLPALLPHVAAVVLSTMPASTDKKHQAGAARALLRVVCAEHNKLLA